MVNGTLKCDKNFVLKLMGKELKMGLMNKL